MNSLNFTVCCSQLAPIHTKKGTFRYFFLASSCIYPSRVSSSSSNFSEQDLDEAFNLEQLTFEVVNWAKPLHSVVLNIQLLAIFQQGGNIKQYLAKLTRDGIDELFQDFKHVLQSNRPILCRSLVQKVRPPENDGASKIRQLEQWVMNDAEFITRLCEAGFAPQTFWPLRKQLGQLTSWLLERHVEELPIHVPLSTFAYCIVDPYNILGPDEVHFGFSTRWNDPDR